MLSSHKRNRSVPLENGTDMFRFLSTEGNDQYHLRMAKNARERLLTAAEELFYAEGIRAVGVERILEESGVGRASFYRHFASKDDLVVEVLRGRDVRYREWMARSVEARAASPHDRPLAVFDVLADRFAQADFRGCAFINTIVETADAGSAAHRAADEHKRAMTAYLEGLLADAGWSEAESLAEQQLLLMDGATVTAVRENGPKAASRSRTIFATLLAAAG